MTLPETDQITAIIRDMTPAEQVGLIGSLLAAAHGQAREVAKDGHACGPSIALALALSDAALGHLANIHGRECVADQLAEIQKLVHHAQERHQ